MSDWKKGPCMGCDKRVIACHANCSEYISWKQNYTAMQDLIKEEREKASLSFLATPYRRKNYTKER